MSSIDETSIKFTWNANKACDTIQYSLNGGGWIDGNWPQTNITGLSANTQYSVKIRVRAQDSKLWTESGVKYVTTYAYPYCTSRPDFKIGSKLNLQFYNPLNRTMQIQMWSHKSQSFVSDLISVTGTSYSGFDNIIDRLYASIPNDTESKYNIDVHYAGNKAINEGGRYYTKGTENPVFSNFSYEDTNDKTKELTGNNQILVNGYSNLKVTISTANKAYSNYASPINKYRLNVGNMSSVEAAFSNTNPVDISISSINSPSITVTAIDGRNYTTPESKTATFKGYFKPIIKSMIAERGNGGVGSQVTLSFDGEWWNDNFGAVANSIKNIEYYYKKTTDTNWTKGNVAIIPTINENNFSGSILIEGPNADDKGFDVSTSYNIKMSVIDSLATSAEYQTILGTGTPAIAICDNKVAIGQKYDEELGGALQVKGEVIEQGLRVSPTQPETNERVWIQCKKNFFNKNIGIITGDYYIEEDGSIGREKDGGAFYQEIYIEVDPNTTYTLSRNSTESGYLGIAQYNDNKIFIKGILKNNTNLSSIQVTTNSDCRYVRISGSEMDLDTLKFENPNSMKLKNDNGEYEEFYNESNMNKINYSTEEQVIGTWTDGKPIYRRVIGGSTGSSSSETYIILGTIPNLETIITLRGFILQYTGIIDTIPAYWDNNLKIIPQVNSSGEIILTYGNNYINRPYTLIIEYTKSTD